LKEPGDLIRRVSNGNNDVTSELQDVATITGARRSDQRGEFHRSSPKDSKILSAVFQLHFFISFEAKAWRLPADVASAISVAFPWSGIVLTSAWNEKSDEWLDWYGIEFVKVADGSHINLDKTIMSRGTEPAIIIPSTREALEAAEYVAREEGDGIRVVRDLQRQQGLWLEASGTTAAEILEYVNRNLIATVTGYPDETLRVQVSAFDDFATCFSYTQKAVDIWNNLY
jgi:hypothetical protein